MAAPNYGRKPCHDFTNGRGLQIFRVPTGTMSREAAEERALAQLRRAPYMDDGPAAAATPFPAPPAQSPSASAATPIEPGTPPVAMPTAALIYREMNGHHAGEPMPRDADGLPNSTAVYARLNTRRSEPEADAPGQEPGAAVAPGTGFSDSAISRIYSRWNATQGDEAA